VSPAKLAQATGARRVRAADADTVARITGFPAGAVPPVGHPTRLPVYMDRALVEADLLYAGAGAPDALFEIRPEDLRRVTSAEVVDLHE
jgi:prolyl-tRNA editing enzyme YbaK/EbsC (Cys-tRNA(Pro) deacylase)